MKTLATIGDNCVDIYPQLNKAFSGGNAVNVAVYCTRYGIQPGCDTGVGDEDYGSMLKQDLVHAAIWGHAEDAFPQLHAAGKLTAFDFSDKWDSSLWQTLVPHLDFAFASAPQEDEALRLKMKAIVALGAGGGIAWDGAQFWRQAPEPVTVIDTMGAGDSFIAGFLCGWSAGMTLPQ
ncbi:PfkB family carbohydrate kinase, partial [Escherichia marmotae]|nr:PfkB family carbohydrate kinase [Escherichia marmotae]